jgi:hypothetical protein
LVELDEGVQQEILACLGIPIARGLNARQLGRVLGRARKTLALVRDRRTYEYVVGDAEKYHLSCTVHEDDGLIYVVMMRGDWRRTRSS